MSNTVRLSESLLSLGIVQIKINGLLHFYARKIDIKSIHAYIDDNNPTYKYTIDVMVNSSVVHLQYSDKELSKNILLLLE